MTCSWERQRVVVTAQAPRYLAPLILESIALWLLAARTAAETT